MLSSVARRSRSLVTAARRASTPVGAAARTSRTALVAAVPDACSAPFAPPHAQLLQQRTFAMYENVDFPRTDGRVIHLDVTEGEIANRILCCGEGSRARKIADMYLDGGPEDRFELVSHREFVIITGRFNDVPVSIIGTLMGFPNTDFVTRECRAVTRGPLALIRFGSCGGLNETKAGMVAVADKTISIYRNPAHWHANEGPPYITSPPIPGDAKLTALLRERMEAHVGADGVCGGINASADTFYASQGRAPVYFDDRNETLLQDIEARHPDLAVCEMETNHLFDLASMAREPMHVAGAAMVYANRRYKNVTTPELAEELVKKGGKACLEALTQLPLPEDELMSGPECVWNK